VAAPKSEQMAEIVRDHVPLLKGAGFRSDEFDTAMH
jgi:hypothetical protein